VLAGVRGAGAETVGGTVDVDGAVGAAMVRKIGENGAADVNGNSIERETIS